MQRHAKRRVITLGFTVLALMILYVACFGMHSGAVDGTAIQRELMNEGWTGIADETHLLSPGSWQGFWQGFWPDLVSVNVAENNSSPESGEMAGAPAVVFQSWRGFALKGNESHSIRVSIESLRPVEAMNIRKLMASNKTLEEIGAEIRKEEGKVIQRGVVRIGDDIYRLNGISMVTKGNKTVLDADVLDIDVSPPKFGSSQKNASATIGHLNVSLCREDGGAVSQGVLLMKSGKYYGKYRVLLDGQHWDGEMRGGMAGLGMPRRDVNAEQVHPFGPPGLS